MNRWLSANLILKPAYRLLGEPVASCRATFEQTQWLSGSELRAYQIRRLRAMLHYAHDHIQYYKAKIREAGLEIDKIDDLAALTPLPVLTRDDVRRHAEAMKSDGRRFRTTTRKTSGSSGAPLLLQKDSLATGVMNAIMWRNYGWFGISMGDRQARVWAGPVTTPQRWKMRIIDSLQNRIRLSSFVMTSSAFDSFIEKLIRFRPQYLYGYSQSLYRLAMHVLESRADVRSLDLKAVLTTAEMISDRQKETIEAAFQTCVVDEYGCTEAGIIAMTCPAGRQHVMADNLLLEIVKDGRPAPPGVEGEIVLTELYGSRMPLIRYRVGDRGVLSKDACPCGRGLPVLERLSGRITDYITCPDGTTLDPYVMEFFLKARPEFFAAVGQWSIRQISQTNLLVTLCTKDADRRRDVSSYLQEMFQSVAGPRFQLDFRYEDSLQTEPSGKTRVFSPSA